MVRLLISLSKYIIIFLMLFYTYEAFMVIGGKKDKSRRRR